MISLPSSSSMESREQPQTKQLVVPTELLREKVRNYSRKQREKQRARTCDALRFGLGEILTKIQELNNLTEKDVSGLASRIKHHKHASLDDMYRLNHAFLQAVENINVFAKIPGAIQVIVKELTGNDAERQIAACESLCNMSLSGAPVCEKIVSMGGSYLITYLSSSSDRLRQTVLWTLANILATENCKGAHTLIHMELLPKLWNLYADDNEHDHAINDGLREEAAVCLNLISLEAQKLLRKDDIIFLMHNLHRKNPTSASGEYHLKIIFNCEIVNKNVMLTEHNSLYLINYALSNLCNCKDFTSATNRTRVLYALRILTNMLASQPMPQILNLFLHQISSVWHTNLVSILNKLLDWQNDDLTKESLWLLKTFLEHQHGEGTALMELNFLSKLHIYAENKTQNTTQSMEL